MKPALWLSLALVLWMLFVCPAYALVAQEVLVVYNDSDLPLPGSEDYDLACQIIPASEGVARYYAEVRNIPSSNVLGLSLLPFTESCNETQYINYIATPISNYLSTHPNIKCIVLCYGIPSRIIYQPNYDMSVDSALTLLGNPGVPNAQGEFARHWVTCAAKNVHVVHHAATRSL